MGSLQGKWPGKVNAGKLSLRKFCLISLLVLLGSTSVGVSAQSDVELIQINSNDGSFTLDFDFSSVGNNWRWAFLHVTGPGADGSSSDTILDPVTSRAYTNFSEGVYIFSINPCIFFASDVNEVDCLGPVPYYQVTVSYPIPLIPSSFSVPTTSTSGTYSLSWGATAGTHELQRQINGGAWVSLQNSAASSYSESSLTDGTHGYRVRACDLACSAWTSTQFTVVTNTPSFSGSITGPTSDDNGSFNLSWSAASGAVTHYTLQRSQGSWQTIQQNLDLGYPESALSDGLYSYRVQACNSSSCSNWLATKTVQVLSAPSIPGSINVPSTSVGSHPVSWGTSSGAVDSYDAQRRVNGGSWSSIQNSIGTSVNESNLADGLYEYRIQACNALSCSAFNAIASVQVANVSGTPGSISGQSFSTTGNYSLFWGAASGAVDTYNLERRVSGGSWSNRLSSNTLSVDETGLASNIYEYRVQACNSSACSGWTAIHTIDVVLAPGIPSSINVSPTTSTDGNFTITWAASGGISSFHEVDRQNNGGAWTNIASKSSSPWTYTDTGLSNGIYTYRVRGCYTLSSTTNCSSYATATPYSVSIASSSAPTLSVLQPASGSQFVAGDPVLFLVSASDTNDGDLSASVQWSSNLDGVLGTGDGLIVSSLSVGVHTITTSVVNSSDLSTSVNTSLTVVSAGSGSVSREVFNGTFDSTGDTQGFVYLDDVFRNSASPNYASGSQLVDTSCDNGGCLYVELAGIDANNIDHMSGAWQKSFTLSAGESASITFRYFFDQGSNYESSEFSEAIFSVDGVQIGTQGNDYLFHVAGDGDGGIALSTNGWVTETFDLGQLGAGSHTIEIGAYNNRKTSAGEFTSMWIDDIVLTADGGSSTPQAPTVSITQPLAGSQIIVGSSVSFSVSASDAIDGDISANVQWASDIDGVFGTGSGFTVSSLSVGVHNIAASVLNSSGLSTVATTSLTVASSGSGSGSGSGSQVLFTGTFDSAGDTQGFVYQGDAFRNTANPSYASGTQRVDSSCDTVGCLYLELGGIDSTTVLGMSAGWQKSFTLAAGEAASISLRYSLNQGSEFESDEFSEAIIAIDGVPIGTLGNDYLFHVAGDGGGGAVVGTNGWITETLNLGVLGAGNHTISIGSYNNKKTYTNEITVMWIDDVVLTTTGSGGTANTAPTINIAAPSNAASVSQGQNVAFAASATDAEDGELSALIQWSSNLDGNLGAGAIINITNLSVGTHQVTATITDMAGAVTSDVMTITVTSGGSGLGSGSREVFNGTFNSSGDAQGFVYLDDVFRNSASPNYASGNHLVDASCDNGGCLYVELAGIDANNIDHMSGAWQKSFTLSAGESASITFRYFFDQGSNYESSEFSEAIFSVDGVQIGTQGNDYLFHVAGDGDGGIALSTNGWVTETFDLGQLGAGSHTIEIGAYNNRKTSAGEFTSMWIDDVALTATGGAGSNATPTINILTPVGSSNFSQGQTVVFSAIANDTEDGDSSSSIQWNSNLDGNLGSGLIYISNLSLGAHQITASITDLDGATASELVAVNIAASGNNAPSVSISTPVDGANLSQGSTATFTASANDVEDGDLSANVQWTSNINGLLGSGSTLSTSFLSLGSHTITASIMDSNSTPATDIINVTVSISAPSTPGAINLPITDDDGSYALSWGTAPGSITSYELQRKTFSGNWTTVQNINSTSFSESGISGSNFSYQVRACSNTLCSAWTPSASIQILSANPPSAIDPSNDPIIDTEYTGRLAGSFSVGKDGNANYGISIYVPPGINGVQPNLSLRYQSARRNGLLGWGWSVSGLSSISRCPATLQRDGFITGINDGENYRYCMGGQHLVNIGGNEYRTENESYTRIFFSSGVWTVHSRSGRVMIYGGTSDSTMESAGGQTVTWYVNKTSDTSGNYFNVSYDKNASTGEHRPTIISYTKNDSGSSLNNSVEFIYENRSDVMEKFVAGAPRLVNQRLARVEVKANGNLVRNYQLDYQSHDGINYAEPTYLSRLTQVQMCYENLSHCAPATEFAWSDAGKSVYTPMVDNNLSNPDSASAIDKQTALTRLQNSTFSPHVAALLAAEPFTFGTSFNTTEFNTGVPVQQAYELSGGLGLSSDTSFLAGGSCLDYLKAAGASRLDFSSGSLMTSFSNLFFFEFNVISTSAHIDGNSSLDLLRWSPTEGWLIHYDYLENLQSTTIPAFTDEASCENWGNNYIASTPSVALPDVDNLGTPVDLNKNQQRYKARVIDLNGDGKPDLMFSPAVEYVTSDSIVQTVEPVVLLNTTSGFVYSANYSSGNSLLLSKLIDLNGDGLPDQVFHPKPCIMDGNVCDTQSSSSKWITVSLNTGNGWQGFETWNIAPWSFYRSMSFADVNGDQLPDMVGYEGEVLINTGSSFQSDANWPALLNFYETADNIQYKHVSGSSCCFTTTNKTSPPINLRDTVADMNGDGLADIVTLRDEGVWVRLSSGTGFLLPQRWTTQVKRSDLLYGTLGDYFSVADINRDGYGDIIFSTKRLDNSAGLFRYAARGHFVGYSKGKVTSAGGFNDGFTIHKVEENLQAIRWNESQVRGNTSDIPRFAGQEFDALWGHYGREEIPMHITSIKKDVTKSHTDISLNYGLLSDPNLYQIDTTTGGVVQHAASEPAAMRVDSSLSYSGYVAVSYHPPARPVGTTALKRRYRIKSVDIFDGQDDTHTRQYQYFNAGKHTGWGDLGFGKVTVTQNYNDGSDIKQTTTQYSQVATDEYLHAGYKLKQTSWVTDLQRGVLQKTSEMTNHWNVRTNLSGAAVPHFGFDLDESNSQFWDLNGAPGSVQTSRVLAYFDPTPNSCGNPSVAPSVSLVAANAKRDSFGNIAQQVSVRCGNGSTHVTSVKQLFQDPAAAMLGKETDSETTRTTIAGTTTSQTRTSSATYDSATRVLTTTQEPNDPLLTLTSTFAYDANGQVNNLFETWNNQSNDGLAFTSKQSTINTSFNTFGERTVATIDALNLSATQIFDARGLLISSTGINGLTTMMVYDALGRPTLETRPDSTTTQIDYLACGSCANPAATYYLQNKTTGAQAVREYFDVVGRSVGTESYGLNGAKRFTETNFDRRGRTKTQSIPYGVAETPLFTQYDYDTVDRAFLTTSPDTSTTLVEFDGFTTTITNSLSQQNSRVVDAIGQVIQSTDNNGTSVFMSYTPFGDLRTSTLNGNVTTIDYDNLGRRIMLDDPDTGVSLFTNNIFGAVSRQTDAKGQITQFSFDKFGRQIGRVDDVNGNTQIHSWNYFNTGNGIGQLQSVTGVDTDGNPYGEAFSYNSLGLPETTTITIDGVAYKTAQYYDAFSRPSDKVYPTGYKVRSEYNNNGFLFALVDPANKTLWAANADDARGSITQFSLGNGVITDQSYNPATGFINTISAANGSIVVQDQAFDFDSLGNLNQRQDIRTGLDQHFCYDNLNRLKDDSFNGCSASSSTYQYDALGNITAKSDVGAYQYAQTGNAGPHAVTSAGGTSYQYDQNGNLISATGTQTRTVDYSAFGKPKLMTGNGKQTTITYGSNQNRIKRVDDNNRTMTYIGGILEKVEDANSTIYRHYIAEVAVYIQEVSSTSSQDQYQYFHHDHIGTLVATSNAEVLGQIDVEWAGMNAWGERLVSDWSGVKTGSDFPTFATDKGFTGHEHLDGVGLIHMNGRVYDPEIGRFLSADPLIQAPFNTQSYNRYSYVFNNPVSFVDPSGYCAYIKSDSCDAAGGYIEIDYNEGTASAGNYTEQDHYDENGNYAHTTFEFRIFVEVEDAGGDEGFSGDGDATGAMAKDQGKARSGPRRLIGKQRSLTVGEETLFKDSFGSSIDLTKVKLIVEDLTPGFAFRVIGNTISIDYRIYQADFSIGTVGAGMQSKFLHEGVHIWQGQNIKGYSFLKPLAEHRTYSNPYLYVFDISKKFTDYRFEQQGEIFEDYTRNRLLGNTTVSGTPISNYESLIYGSIIK